MMPEPISKPTEVFLRSEEHTSELQSQSNLVCRLLLEKKKKHICDLCVCELCDICPPQCQPVRPAKPPSPRPPTRTPDLTTRLTHATLPTGVPSPTVHH